MPFILILALIAAGGGISYKAESAVPGDVLYVVKTHVDEPVQSLFSFSAGARAHAAADQAGARLGEAEELASQGLLDTATKSSLDADFKEKSDIAIQNIKSLADSGNAVAAYDQATAFRRILEDHQVGLAHAYRAQTDSASLAAGISATVSVALGEAETMQDNALALAKANGQTIAVSNDIGAPEAGGPLGDSSASRFSDGSSSADESTTSTDPFSSAILTLLSKVI